MIDMAGKQIIPAVMKYAKNLADSIVTVKEAGCDASVQTEVLNETSKLLAQMQIVPPLGEKIPGL